MQTVLTKLWRCRGRYFKCTASPSPPLNARSDVSISPVEWCQAQRSGNTSPPGHILKQRGRTSLMEWAGMKGQTLLLKKIKRKQRNTWKKKLMHFPSSRSKEQKLDQVPGNIVLIAIDFSWRKQKQWISSGLVVACQRACVGGNSELSKHEGRQMSDLQGGGRCWSHLPTVNRPCALNKQTQSLACYQRWPFGSPLRRNNHFQSPQLKTMEPRGFGIAEWEQLPAAPQWLVISF